MPAVVKVLAVVFLMFRFLILLILFSCVGLNAHCYTGVPRPLGSEKRIKIINYMPNTVYKFVGHYEFVSIIEFGLDEEIQKITMGTSKAWQITPEGSRMFIKPIEDDAETNMTIITSKRTYFFELHAEEADDLSDDNLSFVVKFLYPASNVQTVKQFENAKAPDLSSPELYNFDYVISGNSYGIEPILVFDDGEFTYFKFRDMNTELPAIFLVDPDNNESLANYRLEHGYVVIEHVASRFTLRHGAAEVVCVVNKRMAPKKQKSRKLFGLF